MAMFRQEPVLEDDTPKQKGGDDLHLASVPVF
jgi:hypothetical protein